MMNDTIHKTLKRNVIVFREVPTVEELLKSFRLRYEVYQGSRLRNFSQVNNERLDIDSFDFHARHFQLCVEVGDHFELIGCLRVIDPEFQFNSEWSTWLSRVSKVADRARKSDCSSVFPMCTYGPEASNITRQCIEWRDRGEHVVEIGRLSMLPVHRSLSRVRFMTESIMALGFFGGYHVDRALFTCNSTHRAFYRRYGLRLVPGTSIGWWHERGANSCALFSTPSSVPVSYRSKLIQQAQSFDSSGMPGERFLKTIALKHTELPGYSRAVA